MGELCRALGRQLALGFYIAPFALALCSTAHADTGAIVADIVWDRLRPLANDPALDSGIALDRACVPGEAVVVRAAIGAPMREMLGLRRGQFVTCIGNSADGALKVVDGPGTHWKLARNAVDTTRGFPSDWTAHDRDYLVWAYDRHTLIFRESLRGSFEGNFFYLLLGDASASQPHGAAMLIDSGTGYADLLPYVQPLLEQRQLYIVSTHNHSDHYGGDRHFLGVPNVTFIGHTPGPHYEPFARSEVDNITAAFQLQNWPAQTADFMLGARRLTIIPTPGHTADSIAIYDHAQQLLFSSDTIYPGLLFIEDWPHCVESLARLATFANSHPVKWVLGGHIEMSAARPWNHRYEYFNFGSNTHLREHDLQLPPAAIATVKKLMQQARDAGQGEKPFYDARIIEQEFHEQPFAPVSLRGISRYYRDNNDRLLNELQVRHEKFDAMRTLHR